jgi:hypothetical protein
MPKMTTQKNIEIALFLEVYFFHVSKMKTDTKGHKKSPVNFWGLGTGEQT